MLIDRPVTANNCEIGNNAAQVACLLYNRYAGAMEEAIHGADHPEVLACDGDIDATAALDIIRVVPVFNKDMLTAADNLRQ